MKRFLCLMLTLIMLVSLVPAAAITASAASFATSEAAITVLKKMTTFKDQCYQVADTQEFRIGYGTVCSEKHKPSSVNGVEGYTSHTITEKQADTALRAVLKEMDKKVDSFASTNKLSLKQNQHDALVVFSFNVGTAWMSGNGPVKTAIVSGANVNDLLKALATLEGDSNRRLIEVNMYVHGVYSNVVPEVFKTVVYDAQGGVMTPHDAGDEDTYTMLFDTTQTVAHPVTPIQQGFKFMGWYNADEGGQRVANLTGDCEGKTLYALWQDANLKDDTEELWNETAENVTVNYSYKVSQLPSLHAYYAPNGKEYEAGTKWLKGLKSDSKVTIWTEYMDAKGVRWGNIDGKGWVVMPGSKAASGSGSNNNADVDVTVTVTNSYVNSRKNATIFSAKNGSYSQGAKLRIISTASADGFLWGQIAKSADDNTPIGWVALMYTNWNSVKGEGSSEGGSSNSNAIGRATVTYNGYVNLRSGAGTDNKIVGSLYKFETVDIFEIKTVNGHQWGRCPGGWLCLTYTDLTMLGSNKNDMISNEGALNYVFTGDLNDASADIFVSPNEQAETVQETYEFKDKDKKTHTVDLLPKAGAPVTISNMVIRSEGNNPLWVKIGWRVDMDDDGTKDTTKYGWVNIEDCDDEEYGGLNASLSLASKPVGMDPARFNVVANEVTVRDEPSNGANALPVKLNKGVNVQVNAIKLVGENMWGYIANEIVAGDSTDVGSSNSKEDACNGWINLASKYVQRSNVPTIEGDKTLTPTGKIATIVGSDSVNVRITGSTSGKIVGKLSRGTQANILETSKNGDWYNLDIDVDKNPATGSWVYKQYVEISDGVIGGSGSGSSGNGSSAAPVYTGKGVVANTYAGVNVRKGPGQSYALVGKLLPGTIVDVQEKKQGGAAQWYRIAEGWVCADYVTMLSEEVTYPEGSTTPDGSTTVGSFDEVAKTTTTAVYTGKVASAPASEQAVLSEDITDDADSIYIFAAPKHHGVEDTQSPSFAVRKAYPGENLTIYELLTVTETFKETTKDHLVNDNEPDNGHGSVVEKTVTSYWARVNDGYIFNPHDNIDLDPLDEKVHTLTGADTLKVRPNDANGDPDTDGTPLGKLEKGDQVKVTKLKIVYDKVWGRIEFEGHIGWIRLDYMSEGAYKVQEKPTQPETPAPTDPIIGAGGSNGGFVNNSKGYRYTGKVINTNQVNVRATPATSAKITTTLKSGASLVIYETTTAESMAWGRCDAGWIYLYYVDLTPVTTNGAVDARVVANNKAGIIYSDSTGSDTVGTYAGMSVIDIFEIVNGRARTDLGWISTDDLL